MLLTPVATVEIELKVKKLRLRMPDDTLKMDSWLLLVYISVAVVINATRKDMNYKSHKIVTSLLTTVLLLGK